MQGILNLTLAIPSVLKNNSHLIFNDPKLSNIFKQKPVARYQIKIAFKSVIKSDIAGQHLHSHVLPFGKSKLCCEINTANFTNSEKFNITEKTQQETANK